MLINGIASEDVHDDFLEKLGDYMYERDMCETIELRDAMQNKINDLCKTHDEILGYL
jgi:hypothetical protein